MNRRRFSIIQCNCFIRLICSFELLFSIKLFIMRTLLFLLAISYSNALLWGQIKLKDRAPLSDKLMVSANTESLSLIKAMKKNGLVVVFSCNTCPFVVGSESFPGWEGQYNDLYEQANKYQIGLVVVNSNEGKRTGDDSFIEMKNHAEKKAYNMPYLMDENSVLANAFGAKTTPHVYFFNEKLSLIYMGSIDNIWDKNRTQTIPYLMNAMLAKSQGNRIKIKNTTPKGCSIKRTK